MRLVRRNADKPHRCPVCHAVTYRHRPARWPATSRCARCHAWWFTGRLGDVAGADTFAEYCMKAAVWERAQAQALRAVAADPVTGWAIRTWLSAVADRVDDGTPVEWAIREQNAADRRPRTEG